VADEPEIVGVHIPAYKNLTDVWGPWSDGLALVGTNGAGKTDLLEAHALLIGTKECLRLGSGRSTKFLDRLARAKGLHVQVVSDFAAGDE